MQNQNLLELNPTTFVTPQDLNQLERTITLNQSSIYLSRYSLLIKASLTVTVRVLATNPLQSGVLSLSRFSLQPP